jgi:5-methylcytosine-specific restriction endonuclease McrA
MADDSQQQAGIPPRFDYARYINSAEWRARRQPALDRALGVCERCRCTPLWLEVHHKHYRTLGAEVPDDLEALCNECHEQADRERIAAQAADHDARRADGWARKVYGSEWESWKDGPSAEVEFDCWLRRKGLS